MDQYCFVCWHLLSSVVVCNAAGVRAGRPPCAWAVWRPTLHGGPVHIRPVRATSCFSLSENFCGYAAAQLCSKNNNNNGTSVLAVFIVNLSQLVGCLLPCVLDEFSVNNRYTYFYKPDARPAVSNYRKKQQQKHYLIFAQSTKMGTVTKGFDTRLANRPFLVFDFRSGTQGLNPEYQSARKS